MSNRPWKILAIDDKPEITSQLERVFARGIDGQQISFSCENSFSVGLERLKDGDYDLVFLDLHEGEDVEGLDDQSEDQRGEEILLELRETKFVPVVFYTGYSNKISNLESPLVKVLGKGGAVEEIRMAVKSLLDTKIPHLLRYIQDQTSSYLWGSYEQCSKDHPSEFEHTEISLILARRLSNKLSTESIRSYLGIPVNEAKPIEMYQYPYEGAVCRPTDLMRDKEDQSLWMVFTAACDFEQNKAQKVLLARVTELKSHRLFEDWTNAKKAYDENKDNKKVQTLNKEVKDALGNLKQVTQNRYGARYKFLPGTFFLNDSIVDFQDLKSVNREDGERYEGICCLESPYSEEMLLSFSNYYGRIGTPDFDKSSVWQGVESRLLEDAN